MNESFIYVLFVLSFREAQGFVEKFEGALGKGKGRRLYAFKVMMTKVQLPNYHIAVLNLCKKKFILIFLF